MGKEEKDGEKGDKGIRVEKGRLRFKIVKLIRGKV